MPEMIALPGHFADKMTRSQ